MYMFKLSPFYKPYAYYSVSNDKCDVHVYLARNIATNVMACIVNQNYHTLLYQIGLMT